MPPHSQGLFGTLLLAFLSAHVDAEAKPYSSIQPWSCDAGRSELQLLRRRVVDLETRLTASNCGPEELMPAPNVRELLRLQTENHEAGEAVARALRANSEPRTNAHSPRAIMPLQA
jgi:hypothetical protein